MDCRSCGQRNREKWAKFCGRCGAALVETVEGTPEPAIRALFEIVLKSALVSLDKFIQSGIAQPFAVQNYAQGQNTKQTYVVRIELYPPDCYEQFNMPNAFNLTGAPGMNRKGGH